LLARKPSSTEAQYGASIVAPWLHNNSTLGGIDVIWLASTWDPYRVVMLRTNIH